MLPKLKSKSLLVFSSCTKYVSYNDLSNMIGQYLNIQKFSFQLLFNGLQDYDHPIKSLDDENNYIKCLIFYIEKDNHELCRSDKTNSI
jgi:23S rRNA G2069 N7-methylase RlmK/C1962 C5-methylase RlmI